MSQLTPLEKLLYHLDKAASIAFSLQGEKELGVDMGTISNRLDYYINSILEHNDETDIPTDND